MLCWRGFLIVFLNYDVSPKPYSGYEGLFSILNERELTDLVHGHTQRKHKSGQLKTQALQDRVQG